MPLNRTIKIPLPPGFDFQQTLWFLDRRLDDCMHEVTGDRVRKLLRINGTPTLIEISESNHTIVVDVLEGNLTDKQAIAYLQKWFDLDRDLRPFYVLLAADKDLAPLLQFKGFHMVGIPDLFETLCWCVIGQQISLDFAHTVKRRLVEKHGTSINHNGKSYYLFPTPEALARLKVEDLRALQLTIRKSEYIIGIASLFLKGGMSEEKLLALSSEELMVEELMKIRGIGEWTANYTLMKSLRAMNRVPHGDVGVNNALVHFKGFGWNLERKSVEEVFSRFEGWKTYLVYYLWRSLRGK